MIENLAFNLTKREINNLIINIESWGRGELDSCPKTFAWGHRINPLEIAGESFNSPPLKLVIGKLFMPTVLACIHHGFIVPINLRELWSGSLFKRRHNIVAMT